MQDLDNTESLIVQITDEKKIEPNDELYIRVSSFDEVAFNFFGSQMESRGTGMTDESISLISYIVNDNGTVFFPIIGKVSVEGMTLLEATSKFEEQLSAYFNQPTVLIKFVNKKVTVLGEVARPGYYTFTKNELVLLEAIGMAGDLTSRGNRKEVTLLRKKDGELKLEIIDITKREFMTSQYYFIQPGDVIYVKPLRAAVWDINSLQYNLILSSITTFLLVLNFVTR